MIRFDPNAMFKLGVGLALVAAPIVSANAEYRCDKARTAVDERACTIALQGPDELRRFVERTRMIHALRFQDYRQPEEITGVARSDSGTTVTVALRSRAENHSTTR